MKFGPEITESVELRFARLARARNADGRPIISLGLGEPDFATPDAVIAAATEAMRAGLTRYSSPSGLAELRAAIAAKLADDNGIAAQAGNIIVASGAKMALSLALGALLEPGDEIVIISPCYTSYVPQAKIAETSSVVRPVALRRQDFGLDLGALAGALNQRTRVVLLNSPHNPTGHMLTAAEMNGLVAVLSESNAWIISDEIYEQLAFGESPHLSPAARPEFAPRTVTINGFSKAYAMTGWRIGYAHVPDPAVRDRMSRLQQHLNTNTPPFIQMAALAALRLPGDHIAGYRRRLAANAAVLARNAALAPQLRVVRPDGGLFAFVDIRATGLGSDAFAADLLETTDVAVTPGIVFGQDWDNHVRISLAIAEAPFAEGAARLVDFTARRP